MTRKILYSGGAQGADYYFGLYASSAGFQVVHYYGDKAKTPFGTHPLNQKYINQGVQQANKVCRALGKNTPSKEYIQQMIGRNWWQVAYTQAVYCIAPLTKDFQHVSGGTGWAVEEAIKIRRVPFIFCLDNEKMKWFQYSYIDKIFQPIEFPSEKPDKFDAVTGIGTRDLNKNTPNFIQIMNELQKLFK